MAETNSGSRVSIMHLILIPSVITLAVTIIRLIGELNNWSDFWFSRKAGGGGSPIGISWLAPIFGIYFALKLSREGEGPSGAGRAIGFALLGIVAFVAIFALGLQIWKQPGSPGLLGAVTLGAVVALVIQQKAWPVLFKTLIAYGYAARIPVAILMLFAIRGDWGTHYDVPPDSAFPVMSWFMKWVLIGALPQLILWIVYTVTTGLLLGSLAVLIFHRGKHKSGEPVHA